MSAAADLTVPARYAAADGLTVAGARRVLMQQFRAAGIDSPALDARILIGHALALDHAALVAASRRILDADEQDAIAELARRRLRREPVARIVGGKEFWSLPLRLNAATLIPRPETEIVVETALAAVDADGPRTRPLRLLDLGTGSGALLLALLSELPQARGVGTDISVAALMAARDNARSLKLARASFVACDMAAALAGPFDLMVCNPPYIATGDIAGLVPEVRDFEPPAALDGGPDGLDGYRAIAAAAPVLLRAGGALVVELGNGQAADVAALFSAAGLAPQPARADLEGRPRALVARCEIKPS